MDVSEDLLKLLRRQMRPAGYSALSLSRERVSVVESKLYVRRNRLVFEPASRDWIPPCSALSIDSMSTVRSNK